MSVDKNAFTVRGFGLWAHFLYVNMQYISLFMHYFALYTRFCAYYVWGQTVLLCALIA